MAFELEAKVISAAYRHWYKEEVNNPGSARHIPAEDFTELRRRMILGYDDPQNWVARGHEFYSSYLTKRWQRFLTEPESDARTARIIGAALRMIPFEFVVQRYLQASDEEDFIARPKRTKARANAATDIKIKEIVQEALPTWLPESGSFLEADISLERMDIHRRNAKRISDSTIDLTCTRLAEGLDLGERKSASSLNIVLAQASWLKFATAGVVLAAKMRDGQLTEVPFLKPDYVTHRPRMYTPFKPGSARN